MATEDYNVTFNINRANFGHPSCYDIEKIEDRLGRSRGRSYYCIFRTWYDSAHLEFCQPFALTSSYFAGVFCAYLAPLWRNMSLRVFQTF